MGSLRLSDVSLRKRGSALAAQALTSGADVQGRAAGGFRRQLLRSEGGEVEVRATGGLFGWARRWTRWRARAKGSWSSVPLGSRWKALQLTLFSDPHVYVVGVGASVQQQQPLSYRLTMSASLR